MGSVFLMALMTFYVLAITAVAVLGAKRRYPSTYKGRTNALVGTNIYITIILAMVTAVEYTRGMA